MAALQPRSSRSLPLLLLALAALASFVSFAAVHHDGVQPLAQLACLLPLQLAALLFVRQGARR
ncbi:MAG: hypothetical protein VKK98_05315 [Cyanobacteriota bacterium]|nr:hypothetical protein [Cyanobacteriota bacterium]